MKRFKFTLEAVRTVRQQNEQMAMELYATALLTRQQALHQLHTAQKNLDDSFQQLREAMQKGADAPSIMKVITFQKELATRRDICAENLTVCERRLNVAMQKMLEARQQCEVTEKFYDAQKADHQRAELRAEQKVLDELASRRLSPALSWNAARN